MEMAPFSYVRLYNDRVLTDTMALDAAQSQAVRLNHSTIVESAALYLQSAHSGGDTSESDSMDVWQRNRLARQQDSVSGKAMPRNPRHGSSQWRRPCQRDT